MEVLMTETKELVDRLVSILDKFQDEEVVCVSCCDSEAGRLEDRIRRILERYID